MQKFVVAASRMADLVSVRVLATRRAVLAGGTEGHPSTYPHFITHNPSHFDSYSVRYPFFHEYKENEECSVQSLFFSFSSFDYQGYEQHA